MTKNINIKKYINSTTLFSLFRFVFGILMIEQVLSLVPFVFDLQNSHIVLHYPNLEFIEAYSFLLIDILKYTSIAGAFLLAIGIQPRLGALLFLMCFGYLFLIDISFYNNHYYLWCLMAFLFVVVDTHQSYNIIDIIKQNFDKQITDISTQSFKILVSIVYLFAAFVKINPDWLQGYPAILWFESKGVHNANVLGLLMSYSGLFYDALMPILLWFFPRKAWVVIPYFAFHLINSFVFNIGMFPYIMMAAWLLFAIKNNNLSIFLPNKNTVFNLRKISLNIFFLYNILFPLRFLIYDGRTSWHRQGYYFSWRMMLDNYKVNEFRFLVHLPSLNKSYQVKFDQLMNYRQFENTYNDAYCIWYVAQKLKTDATSKYKEKNPEVYNISTIELNQHTAKLLVLSSINLSSFNYKILKSNKYINI